MKVPSIALATVLLTLGFGSSLCLASPTIPSQASEPTLIAQNRTKLIPRQGRERMMEQLNLSAQQKTDLEAIRTKYQGQTKQLMTELRSKQDELKSMMDGTAPTDSIRAKHNEVLALRQQVENLRFQGMLESRDILTVEQRKQFGQLMDQRREQWKNKKGNGRQADESQPPL